VPLNFVYIPAKLVGHWFYHWFYGSSRSIEAPIVQQQQDAMVAETAASKDPQPSPSNNDQHEQKSFEFADYVDETQLEHVMKLVLQDLSGPYSSMLTYCSVA
jgi:hypothetical protein